MAGGEESEGTSGGWDRREFIPRVRHTVRCLKQRGTIWWNPKKSQLPKNFLDRRMCPTAKLNEFLAVSESNQNEVHDIIDSKQVSTSEILEDAKSLVLFVDPPGMGKSSLMTKLEMQLGSDVSSSPRVYVRINLNQVQRTLKSQFSDTETPGEPYNSIRLIQKFVEDIRVSLLQQTFPVGSLPLIVLLDGLDEVCPEYEQIMTHILRSLLSDTHQGLFSVKKVILTTRPQLQTLIEEKFGVKANSLLPLTYEEQVEFLKRQVGLSFDVKKTLWSLPDTTRSLMGNPLMLSLYAEVLKSPGTEIVVNMFDLYSKFVEAKYKRHEEKEEAELASMKVQLRVENMLAHHLKFYFACAVEELVGSTLGKIKAAYLRGASLKRPTGNNLVELINYGLLVSDGGGGCRFIHRSFAEFFYAKLLTHEENEYKKLRAVLFGKMYEHNVALNVESFVREILLKSREEQKGIKSPKSFPRSYVRVKEAALYFGKKRLRHLANGWINTLWKKGEGVKRLLLKLGKSNYSTFRSSYLCNPVKEVRGELAGADDKKRALYYFFNGNLFPFLCGSFILMSLDYGEPDIFESMKYDTRAFGVFLEWMCALGDQSWVKANVFGIKEDSVVEGEGQVWKCQAESAELILMFAVRSDRICEFFSNAEISAALNSLDCVVKVAWRVEAVEVGRVWWTLKKYVVDPQRLKDSLLIHLRTVDDFLSRFFVAEEYHVERVANNFGWSWWYAEVFSRKEIRSFVTEEASRVSNIHRIGWRALKDAWGDEFALPTEPVCELSWPSHEGKTLLDIKEGDLEFVTFLLDEVERGGLKLEGELMEVLREMIFGVECGWQVLEMLERRLFRQRPAETNANNCSFQEPNILEQLFKSEEVYRAILDSLQAKLNSCKSPPDMQEWRHLAVELTNLWAWLPFVVRYSGDTEPGKLIIERCTFLIKYVVHEDLWFLLQTEEYFASAARSFVIDRSASPSLFQLLRSFHRELEREPESLRKLLLEAEEGELRTLIKENSPGPLHTVSHTPLGPILTSLLTKSTSAGSMSTLPLGLRMESPWNAESVAFIFTEIIDTSPCYELPGALKQFHSSFHLDLIKQALLNKQAHGGFRLKHPVFFRKHGFVNTERLCSLRAAIRFYFVVFGEDLRWLVSDQADVNLLLSLPVEILSVLEDGEETVLGGFPPLPIEVRLSLVRQIEEHLRKKTNGFLLDRLDEMVRDFSYHTEADWKRLFQAQGCIPRETCAVGYSSALLDHNHKYKNIVESRLLLIRVWIKYFGEEKTRRTADEQNVWGLLRDRQKVPRGEYLHLAVELGSLEGVKTLAWPGLLKWKNPSGKTAREEAVERWGAQHEISRFLEERFLAIRAFHDE